MHSEIVFLYFGVPAGWNISKCFDYSDYMSNVILTTGAKLMILMILMAIIYFVFSWVGLDSFDLHSFL